MTSGSNTTKRIGKGNDMHNNNFTELSRHKILTIESVVFKDNVVKAILTTSHFNRVTTKPFWFSYKDYLKTIEKMYIGE